MIRFGPYPIPFHGGIDAKSDPKSVRPPYLRDLRDAVYLSPEELAQRPGSRGLGTQTTDDETLGAARAMATRADELLRFQDSKVYSYNEASDAWADRGPLESIKPTLSTIAFAPATQKGASSATANGVTVYAWEDSRSSDSVRYAIYDEATGAAILADTELSATGVLPRVIAIGAAIYIYLWVAGTLYRKSIFTSNVEGSIADALVSTTTGGDATTPVWDLLPYGSAAIIAYRTVAGAIAIRQVGTDGELGSTTTIAEDPARGLVLAANATANKLYVGWCTTAKARFAIRGATAFDSLVAAADHATSDYFYAITAAWDEAGVCHAYWEERPSGATVSNAIVYSKTVTTAGTQGSVVTKRHAGLASHAFAESESVYVMLVFESTLQSTYFLYRDDNVLVGKLLPSEAEGLPTRRFLARPTIDGRIVTWIAPFKRRLQVEAFLFTAVTTGTTPPAQYADLGLKRVDLDFEDEASHRVAEIGKSLYVSGLQLWQYDGGANPVEAGFHLYPESVTNPSSAAGSIPIGSYAYRVYYGWANDKGEVDLSSTAQTILVAVASSTKKVTIRIPTLTHTLKSGNRERVFMRVYRSKIDPFERSPLYLVSSTNPAATGDNGFVWNDETANYVDFVDNMLDAVAGNNERDYLSDGELDRLAPPVGTILAAGKERLYVAGFEDGNKVLASTLRFDGRGIAFNENLEISVDSAGGPITALEVMDDRLIVFKRDRAFIVLGDGPNNLGQGAWDPPQRVTGDVGCIDQRAVAQAPVGVVFQSVKGIRLIDRSLKVSYIGHLVQNYNAQTITAAVALTDDDLIVFLTDEGRTLVFDYELKVWSTWTRYTATDACLWQNQLVRSSGDGRILVKDDDLATDDGESFGWGVDFPHLQPAGPQGFTQIKRALFLGQYHSPHKLRTFVAYDMEPLEDQIDDFNPADEVNASSWGSDASWGAEPAWGGVGSGIEHFEASMPRQKCFAFGLRLEVIPSSTPGAAFTLVGLVCEVAGQPGAYRLRDWVRVAASTGGGGGGPGGGPRRSG